MPRCLTCLRTGFTTQELDDHAKKFSHPRADASNRDAVISELSSDEFEHSTPPSLTKSELLDAMGKLLGADDLKAWARTLISDELAKSTAAGKGGKSSA